jgi:integrase
VCGCSRSPNVSTALAAPFIVRWALNGKGHSAAFKAKTPANAYRARLMVAAEDETRWNVATGLPSAWDVGGAVPLHDWCRTYVAGQWKTSAPNSRRTTALALVYLIERAAKAGPGLTSEQRTVLRHWLIGTGALPADLAKWAARWVPTLDELDGAALVRLDERLRVKLDGTPLAGSTARRQVKLAKRCLAFAVRAKLVTGFEWPVADEGESKRKANRVTRDVRTVWSVEDSGRLMAHLASKQPASHMYAAMTAVALWAGLRPSEVVVLTVEDVDLEARVLHVVKAWNGAGREFGTARQDVGATKTLVKRVVPLPDLLANVLTAWLTRSGIESGPLFRTRTGGRPAQSNWGRALKRAGKSAGVPGANPYACRHFYASHLIDGGVSIPEAARLMGHSKEELVRTYLHDVKGGAGVTSETVSILFR